MNKLLLTLSAAAIALLSACSSDEPTTEIDNKTTVEEKTPRHDIQLSRAEETAIDGLTDFSFELLKEASNAADSNENIIVSPLSVAQALSMLANGATGEALNELTATLGVTLGDISALNSLATKLNKELPKADSWVEMTLSNSIWAKPNLTFADKFKTVIEQTFSASSHSADFTTTHGVNLINSWVDQTTSGMIKQLLSKPISADFIIANTVCFNGEWAKPFDKKNTKSEDFLCADGRYSKVNMMHGYYNLEVRHSDCFTIATLPYGNEAFRMTVILPDKGVATSRLISNLSTDVYRNAIKSETSNIASEISLPRFTISRNDDIKEQLKGIGLSYTLGNSCSDLTQMFSNTDVPVTISMILSSNIVEVTESGTKAASSTGIIGDLTSDSFSGKFTVDRPFVFVIDEVSTGAILFMGAVNRL